MEAKKKYEILDDHAKDKMVEWNLSEFMVSHPSLFAAIGTAMDEFAKQEVIAFDKWKRGIYYTPSESNDDKWYIRGQINSELDYFTNEQLYELYLTSKSKV